MEQVWQMPPRDSERCFRILLKLKMVFEPDEGGRTMCSLTRIQSLGFAAAICGGLLGGLSTAAVAESPEPSLDQPSAKLEATLAELKNRIEELEYRVGHQSTFQGRGEVGRPANGVTK
jgi:hypothetical protein